MKGTSLKAAVVGITVAICSTSNSWATEAAMGRYVPGAFAIPGVGILPPEPGFYWQSSSFYYHGKAGKNLQIPIGGRTQFGLQGDIAATSLTTIWVPELHLGENWTFGVSATLPVQYMKVKASLGPLGTEDDETSIGDMMFAPMIGWHSGTHFLTASLRVFAPTGKYDVDALANNGLNYWTISPNLAYTYIDPTHNIDYSIIAGVDFNTKNPDTDYRSGAMFHLDAMITKTFSNGLGVGIFGSVLNQFEDDDGAPAVLDGFKGRSFAIGPILKYSGGSKEHPLNMSLNWAPEFGVKNRLKGNGFYFNISSKF